eukprot:TRINITY_DN10606_c0_g1_i2.p1 TRINITY_DN10606_c0_g1~~TRINITY_DN10606_c0_g1_i2.p1  ORF type:complete len:462 (+),score=71.72 TRINITY_DN10606_c0_g1_i2:512-1897(+)
MNSVKPWLHEDSEDDDDDASSVDSMSAIGSSTPAVTNRQLPVGPSAAALALLETTSAMFKNPDNNKKNQSTSHLSVLKTFQAIEAEDRAAKQQSKTVPRRANLSPLNQAPNAAISRIRQEDSLLDAAFSPPSLPKRLMQENARAAAAAVSSEAVGRNEKSARSKAASGEIGSSCHQCKRRVPLSGLVFCSNMFMRNSTDRRQTCRKKYCDTCLKKFYSMDPPPNRHGKDTTWKCPKCRGMCSCAACRRGKDDDDDLDHIDEGPETSIVQPRSEVAAEDIVDDSSVDPTEMSPATAVACGLVYSSIVKRARELENSQMGEILGHHLPATIQATMANAEPPAKRQKITQSVPIATVPATFAIPANPVQIPIPAITSTFAPSTSNAHLNLLGITPAVAMPQAGVAGANILTRNQGNLISGQLAGIPAVVQATIAPPQSTHAVPGSHFSLMLDPSNLFAQWTKKS